MPRLHIVGGGIAGTALAALTPHSWEVRLYEAQWEREQVPTLFGLQGGGREALEALGLDDEFLRSSVEINSGRLSAPDGGTMASMKSLSLRMIPRPALLEMLRSRIPPHVEVHRERVDDPRELEGDLIIGADGVHSTVRRELWQEKHGPRRLEATVIRGVTAAPVPDIPFQEVWRSGGMFGITPHPDGGLNWFATVPRQTFADSEEALAALRRRWEGCGTDPSRVLEHTSPELTLVNQLWESRGTRTIIRPNAALIGDAAHAMAPHLGRGASESLADALTLGQALHTMPQKEALQHYQRRRHVPTQLARAASRTLLRVATSGPDRLRRLLLAPLPRN